MYDPAFQDHELHCKKKVSDIPVPSRDVTYQTLPWASRLKTGMSLTFYYGINTVVVVHFCASELQDLIFCKYDQAFQDHKLNTVVILYTTGTTGLNNCRYDPAFHDHELNTVDILRYKAGVSREFANIFAELCQVWFGLQEGRGSNPFISITSSKPLMYLGSWLTLYNFEIYYMYLSAVNYDPAAIDLIFIRVNDCSFFLTL
jgi:hypothetical protein